MFFTGTLRHLYGKGPAGAPAVVAVVVLDINNVELRRRGHLALCWCLVVYAAADMPMDAQAERTRHMSGKEPLIESMHGDMACTSF